MWATHYVDDAFPGFVACRLIDAHGATWTFIEKVPVVSCADLDARSAYPQPATLACHVVATRRGLDGRDIATIDTSAPWGHAATSGETRFDVFADDLTALG